jgi:hypothetical protein
MDDEIFKTNGLDIKNWDATIYRVMPIFRFKEIMATGKMGLTRPALWDDPFENFYLKCKVRISKTEVASLRSISSSWYGQCWTKKRDSDAMWRIYSHNKDGLRISTTIRRLFSAIYDDKEKFATLMYFIGEVEYAERREIEDFIRRTPFTALSFGAQAAPFARTLCIKRPEFGHEDEVRLLIHDAENKNPGDVSIVPFDHTKVLDHAVALDPRLDAAQFKAAKDDLEKAGCTLRITQSDLYKIDEMTIDLE